MSEVNERVTPGEELLTVNDLSVHFPIRSRVLRRTTGTVRAVDGIDLTLAAGETLGLVGESGCGKSTTGQAILQLIKPTGGQVLFRGRDLTTLRPAELHAYRREMQIVLQDPFSSLDPRMTVGQIVAEPMIVHKLYPGAARRRRVEELLDMVGLPPALANRFPHQFSGGQRQRIGIARALAVDPQLLILDEPVSSLDVSIQAQIINLLQRLQQQLSLSYLFIAHDLAVVKHLCDRIAVMYLGKVVETGTSAQVYDGATHPYTQSLLSAVPRPDPRARQYGRRLVLTGDLPSPSNPPSGCRFRTRCWAAQDLCAEQVPELVDRGTGHPSACHFASTDLVDRYRPDATRTG